MCAFEECLYAGVFVQGVFVWVSMFPLDVCKECSRFSAFTTSFQATRAYRVHASNKTAPTVSHVRVIFDVTHLFPNTAV